MELTEIELFGLRILEPVTCLTDLITASVCFFAFYQLKKLGRPEPEHAFFKFYFLFMSLATITAGLIGHAFLYLFSFNWKMIGWTFSALAIFSIERSTIHFAKEWLTPKQLNWLTIVNVAQLVVFFLVILNPGTRSFDAVKANSAIGLVGFVLPLQLISFRKTDLQGHKLVMFAIVAGILPAITFNAEISLHKWFNFHDISHVLMAMVSFVMYLGARYLAVEKPGLSVKETHSIQT